MTKKQPLPTNLSFAELVRLKMKTGDNPTKKPIATRQLAEHLGVSYEHVRMILLGRPSLSRDLCDKLCEYVGLDPDAMWQKLMGEKFKQKIGFIPSAPEGPGRMAELWEQLTPANRQTLEQMAEAMAAANYQMAKRI